jgi:hypothetical protein
MNAHKHGWQMHFHTSIIGVTVVTGCRNKTARGTTQRTESLKEFNKYCVQKNKEGKSVKETTCLDCLRILNEKRNQQGNPEIF